MSIHDLPYPSDFQIDSHADHHEARRRLAFTSLEIGDVLSAIDDLIAQEPDPSKHPCAALVAWLLDKQLTPLDGGALYDGWKALCLQAIDRLVEAKLADPHAWEVD
jgi:hypothetical protein